VVGTQEAGMLEVGTLVDTVAGDVLVSGTPVAVDTVVVGMQVAGTMNRLTMRLRMGMVWLPWWPAPS